MRRGDVFERIRGYSNYTEKDEFVFSQPNKNAKVGTRELYGYFNELVKIVNNKHFDFNVNKNLYCLRHFLSRYASWRVLMRMTLQRYAVRFWCRYRNTMMMQKHW